MRLVNNLILPLHTQVNLLQQRYSTVPSQSPPLHYQHPRSRFDSSDVLNILIIPCLRHEYHDARDDHRHQRHDDYHAPRDHPYHHHRDADLINEFPPQRNCWSTSSFHHRDRSQTHFNYKRRFEHRRRF